MIVSVSRSVDTAQLLRACSTLALAMTALVATPAWAQDQQEVTDAPASASTEMVQDAANLDLGDEITVTGTRASLARSLAAKRNADSIVDVITAEDIGKFPDANVAETLQRVPGVSIDRSGGEGRFASVNGLGPEFVSVLVNGRTIANDNPDRSFSFDTIASELVSSVKVYKSANAIIPEGGIGGTIDIITARPFNYSGFVASAKVGGLYEGNSKELTPQASFLISNRFFDGRLGILASFNYFARNNRTYRVQNSAVIPNLFFDFNSYAYVGEEGEDAFRMQDLERAVDEQKRERIGGTVALQYQATENLELTLDYIYSKLKVENNNNSTMNWFWAVQDTANNVKDDKGVYTTFDHMVNGNVTGYAFTNAKTYRPVETHALGFNAKWGITDSLSANFDVSGSRTINNNRGLDRDYTVEALNQGGFLVKTDGGVPWLEGPNLYVPGEDNQAPLRARITSDSGTYVKSENWQARGDFTFKPAGPVFVNFGGSIAQKRKQNEFWQTPNAIRRMYHGNAYNQPIDTDSIVTGILRPGDVFGNPLLSGDMFIIDGEALRAWMADPVNIANRTRNAGAGGLQEFIANGRTWNAVKSGDSYVIRERVASAYADVHFQTELGGGPFELIGGLRYTHTDLASTGTSRILIDLEEPETCIPTPNNPCGSTGILMPIFAPTNERNETTVDNSYDNFLPSLNARWEFSPGFVARFSAAKTLTRPLLESLAPTISYRSLFKSGRSAVGSNPNLKPFTAINLDASLEYYYGKGNGFSVAAFYKDISDYIVETEAMESIDTITNPAYRMFSIRRPRNAESAHVEGVTVSWLHTFDFGLGFQTNYTKVSGKVSSKSDPTQNFSLPGVSDTANLVGFYERGPIGLRVAWNWRDKFLAQPSYGGYNLPRYFRAFSQIDARLSLQAPMDISLALDVVNLTNKKTYSYGVSENAFISYNDYGRRITLTASKKF